MEFEFSEAGRAQVKQQKAGGLLEHPPPLFHLPPHPESDCVHQADFQQLRLVLPGFVGYVLFCKTSVFPSLTQTNTGVQCML